MIGALLCFLGLVVLDQYDKYTFYRERPPKNEAEEAYDRMQRRYTEFLKAQKIRHDSFQDNDTNSNP